MNHDAAMAVVEFDKKGPGKILWAAHSERYSKIKNDHYLNWEIVNEAMTFGPFDKVVYYEKPLLTFERLLETYLATSPRGIKSFVAAMEVWAKDKLFLKSQLKDKFKLIQQKLVKKEEPYLPKFLFSEHHLSHASSAW